MTALVSLLFVTMIPINCNTCLFTFLVTIIIILVNSQAPCQKKNAYDHKYYFSGCHTHYFMKSSYASELCIHVCSPRYTALQTEESMKTISSCHYGNSKYSLMTVHSPTINESQ